MRTGSYFGVKLGAHHNIHEFPLDERVERLGERHAYMQKFKHII
jgi:hypothetical protein